MTPKETRLAEARSVLFDLGMPRAQFNDRTALCLLALLDLPPSRGWATCNAPLAGITPIMEWARDHFDTDYKPNTRETFRPQSMHQFIEAGICVYNPDDPKRPVNSPKAVYQIEPNLQAVLRTFGTSHYRVRLGHYLRSRTTLTQTYAKARAMALVAVSVKAGQKIMLSPGAHSELIKSIIEEFGPRYAPGGEWLYVGDTGDKHGFFDEELLAGLGIELDHLGKLPDVVVYLRESEVWVADASSHLIHFNGARFLGPYGPA